VISITGFIKTAVSTSAEYKASEINSEFSEAYCTIRPVLNRTLSPKPNSNERFFPSNRQNSKYDAKSFEPFDAC
jgi:hypothetical protein